MKYSVKEIIKNTYLLTFEEHYDLAMFFLRYQEYYESNFPDFKGKAFTIIDFMERYAKFRKGCFSYCDDFAGWNIPSSVIDDVTALGIPDPNKYDAEIFKLHTYLKEKSDKYYLIGVSRKNNENAINHELAHALFYHVPEYKEKMLELVTKLPKKFSKKMDRFLKNGYSEDVFDDEKQAYLSTTKISIAADKNWVEWLDHNKEFKKVFKKYKKENLIKSITHSQKQ